MSSKKQIKNRLGESNINKKGYKATIIEYNSSLDTVIQFEDGAKRQISYGQFIRGSFAHPNYKYDCGGKVGETKVCKNGLIATLVRYGGCRDIDVEFSNGLKLEHSTYKTFKRGYSRINRLSHEHNVLNLKRRTAQPLNIKDAYSMKCGLQAYIIRYINANNVEVEFEDGTRISKTYYLSLESGSLKHTKYIRCEHVGTFEGMKTYMCICRKCRGKHVLRLSEMKDFECEV